MSRRAGRGSERSAAPLAGLAERWRADAALFRRRGALEAAATLDDCASELEAAWRAWWAEELTIADASHESGYSADRLRELVRAGQLHGARPGGRRGEIRLRRCDLPRRPGAAPPASAVESLEAKVLAARR
jgi:hypothetical protein